MGIFCQPAIVLCHTVGGALWAIATSWWSLILDYLRPDEHLSLFFLPIKDYKTFNVVVENVY